MAYPQEFRDYDEERMFWDRNALSGIPTTNIGMDVPQEAGLMGNILNQSRTIDPSGVSLGSRGGATSMPRGGFSDVGGYSSGLVPDRAPPGSLLPTKAEAEERAEKIRLPAKWTPERGREISILRRIHSLPQLSEDWEINNLLRKEEGFNKLKVYGDRPTFDKKTRAREDYPGKKGNKPTLGVGHLVDEDKKILAGLPRFGDLGFTVDFKDKNLWKALDNGRIGRKEASIEEIRELYWNVIFGLKSITPQQEDKLLDLDIKDKTAIAKEEFTPKVWEKLPSIVQSAVLNGYFRGGLSGSPDAIKKMKAGKWKEAAIEYLDHGGYRRSLKGEKKRGRGGLPLGIAGRMERNAAIFYLFGKNPGFFK